MKISLSEASEQYVKKPKKLLKKGHITIFEFIMERTSHLSRLKMTTGSVVYAVLKFCRVSILGA